MGWREVEGRARGLGRGEGVCWWRWGTSCTDEQSGRCAEMGGEVPRWERVGGGTLDSSPARASSPADRPGGRDRDWGGDWGGGGRIRLALLLLCGLLGKATVSSAPGRPGRARRRAPCPPQFPRGKNAPWPCASHPLRVWDSSRESLGGPGVGPGVMIGAGVSRGAFEGEQGRPRWATGL